MPPPTKEQEPLKVFSSEQVYSGKARPRCKELVDTYCNYLYSPEALGNIEIRRSGNSTRILQGDTHNQFSQVYFRYSEAKIRNQDYLPKDLYRILSRHNYFAKLESFLDRKSIVAMDLGDRLSAEQTDFELKFIWSSAFNEALLLRMDHEFPGFHRIPEKLVPVELDVHGRRLRRILISEISRAIWRGDGNWEKVEQGFSLLRDSYFKVIAKLDIPEDTRKDWLKRIAEVQLVMPGSSPEISDEECSTTTVNAYYFTYLNVITVCAGDFNSEDIMQTLSHEMAHSLGVDRSQYLFQAKSDFGRGLSALRSNVCEPQKFSCEGWSKYKERFVSQLKSLEGYRPELPEFQRCLKRRVTSNDLGEEEVNRFARTIVDDRVSELAANDRFLRLTKEKVPLRNGKLQSNPNFLNPCSYYLWSKGEEPIDDELTTMLYFTAEYRCSEKPSAQKLKDAIDVSKQMSERVLQASIRVEGEFSGRNLLETQGYSSPPFERFADVVGSYALAEYLSALPSALDRQNKFLAGNSWLCLEPSLASHFPEESSVEKQFIFDSHTEGDQRKKELLSSPIRKVIGCDQDFDFRECRLPIKGEIRTPELILNRS